MCGAAAPWPVAARLQGSFAALAARLGLSPGRPADIGRCQRGGM